MCVKYRYNLHVTYFMNVLLFCLMIEESGSGSIRLTNGSGSRRPKNIRILQIRIWIRNTAWFCQLPSIRNSVCQAIKTSCYCSHIWLLTHVRSVQCRRVYVAPYMIGQLTLQKADWVGGRGGGTMFAECLIAWQS
jgi:hypothetical protein